MLGLSQEQVADVLRTTGATVGRWERDERTPHPRHLAALAALYRTDVQSLVRPVRPAYARALRSQTRREVRAENLGGGSISMERDPFGWRLGQLLDQRQLDPWAFATRLHVHKKTVTRWLEHKPAPDWTVLCRAADLLDVPAWWWRCGGYDEMDLYGPFELRRNAIRPPDEAYGWEFAHAKAAEVGVPVEDIVRTAYPSWAGWCWQGHLGEWTSPTVPECPVSARLRLAVLARCNEANETVEDTIAWITDVCAVKDLTVQRWLRGERVPRWEQACGVSLALSVPTWSLWVPAAELAVVEHIAG